MSVNKNSTKPSSWVDPEDAPALSAEFFERADLHEGARLVRRGRPAGSTKPDAKQAVKLRLDADVLAALRASGEGWQTRINDSLRASLQLAGKLRS